MATQGLPAKPPLGGKPTIFEHGHSRGTSGAHRTKASSPVCAYYGGALWYGERRARNKSVAHSQLASPPNTLGIPLSSAPINSYTKRHGSTSLHVCSSSSYPIDVGRSVNLGAVLRLAQITAYLPLSLFTRERACVQRTHTSPVHCDRLYCHTLSHKCA